MWEKYFIRPIFNKKEGSEITIYLYRPTVSIKIVKSEILSGWCKTEVSFVPFCAENCYKCMILHFLLYKMYMHNTRKFLGDGYRLGNIGRFRVGFAGLGCQGFDFLFFLTFYAGTVLIKNKSMQPIKQRREAYKAIDSRKLLSLSKKRATGSTHIVGCL